MAESHHCKRDQEENVLLEDTDAFPQGGFVLAAQGVFTVVRDRDKGAVEQGGNGSSNADYPQEERHIHPRAESQAGQWVDHYQIPVDGHDGQEEDAAVKPSEEDKSHYFAKGLGKQPSPDVVNCPEGQTGGEDEVRDGQVQDENVGERLEVFVQSKDYKDEEVSREAQCDHNGEEYRDGDGSKLDHFPLFTDFIVIELVIVGVI